MAHPRRRRHAFTLVELLVVIGIIALLISILLPALSKARQQAATTKCLANMKQVMTATIMYTNDWKGRLPYNGWGDGPGFNTGAPQPFSGRDAASGVPNWAYDGNVSQKRGKYDESDIETGSLWPYVGGKRALFRCPLDSGPWQNTQWYSVMTTFCANGCLGGWGGNLNREVPAYKINQFKTAAAVMFWEVGNQSGAINLGFGWDACNGPQEGAITVRHSGKSTTVGYLDGHANLMSKEQYLYWESRPGGRNGFSENPLWIMPDPAGGGNGGFSGGTPTFYEN